MKKMRVQTMNKPIQIGAAIAFLLMVTVNVLANLLPINGVRTEEVSAAYGNLFTPAGFIFSIWGLIYLLLALYILFQIGFFRKGEQTDPGLLNQVGFFFILSSLANVAWIFSWHYGAIFLSVLWMAVILICLIFIAIALQGVRLSPREKFFLRLPFSVYFGWITIATIANITTLLVYWGWKGWGLSEAFWTILILLVGVAIGSATMLRFRDAVYGLVLIWAYMGILVRHIAELHAQYPSVIIGVSLSLALLVVVVAILLHNSYGNRYARN